MSHFVKENDEKEEDEEGGERKRQNECCLCMKTMAHNLKNEIAWFNAAIANDEKLKRTALQPQKYQMKRHAF